MRLDKYLFQQGYFSSRSKAEQAIQDGLVIVQGRRIKNPGQVVRVSEKIKVLKTNQYVSRAAEKLLSVLGLLEVSFQDKVVLDIGSSTGGFTEVALQKDARRVVAVEIGTNQLHPKLQNNPKISLYEKTDIRDFAAQHSEFKNKIDVVVADVSFISLRLILPPVLPLLKSGAELLIMCKPQFEAQPSDTNKGVVKNSKIRRQILKDFQNWLAENGFIILGKADSKISGAKGNLERFYHLKVR